MSFYLNLSSSDSIDVHPQNYGGEFQVQLPYPLLFNELDPWEVALVEMTYDAQGFPNILPEYTEIKLEALNRDDVYDARNMDFNIKAILQAKKMTFWESDSENIAEYRRVPKYVLPKKYYTWEGFKEAWAALGKFVDNAYFSYAVTFTDTELVIKYGTSRKNVKFVFSEDLIKFLSLESPFILSQYNEVEYNKGTVSVAYKKPVIDDSPIIFPSDMQYDPWIEIVGYTRRNMPKTDYTLNQLAKNFNALMTFAAFEKRINFYFTYELVGDEYWWEIEVDTTVAIDFTFHFSYGFRCSLGNMERFKWTRFSSTHAKRKIAVRGFLPKVKPEKLIYTTRLPFNFYPTAVALCDSLNSTIMELASYWTDAKAEQQPLFSMEKVPGDNVVGDTLTGKCLFKPHPFFNVTIHQFLLNLLHLPNTDKEHTGTAIVQMPSATRDFLYIYTNIISSHTFSGATNILRVINNVTSTPNEKVMISFGHFYYHPVTQLHIPNIQIRITDNHTDLALPFQKDVSCLLHFRRCNHFI